MTRRPRVTWLLDDHEPTGASVMAMRRLAVLGDRVDSSVLVMRTGARDAATRADPPWRAARPVSSLAGELRAARADLLVSTSERTLASAAARRTPHTRLLHFVHERPDQALSRLRVARALPAVTGLVCPLGADLDRVAGLTPLDRRAITASSDFVLPGTTLLASARAKVVLAVGRLEIDGAALDLVEGFRLAALRGWQLRICGGGPGLPQLRDAATAAAMSDDAGQLAPRVAVLGPRHDLAEQYLDAGLVVRLAAPEANGLSVLEALAAGVPVLGSPASPAVERHVEHGVNGWILERTDPPSIAEALRELADDERRAPLAAYAREHPVGVLDAAGRREVQDLFDTVLDTRTER